MSAFRWNYSNSMLTVSVDGKSPVVFRGKEAIRVKSKIIELGNDITHEQAVQIYESAVARNADKPDSASLVLRGMTNEGIVEAMSESGVRGLDIDDSGVVRFNNQPIKGAVGRHIVRTIQQGGGLDKVNWDPMSKFFSRLLVRADATEQLFRWLDANDFSIASDGRVIAYRGVDSEYLSGFEGVGGWIDASGVSHYDFNSDNEGYLVHKKLEYRPGSIVRMRREHCDPNGNNHCSTGIHFGTRSYARSYGTRMMLCLVDPSDVVSIPNDTCEKARTCALEVVGEIGHSVDFVSDAQVEVVNFENKDGSTSKTLHNITAADQSKPTDIELS